jgi:hypothetical protein
MSIRLRNSSSFHTEARTGLTKSIFLAPNMSCSVEDAHCMKFQVASLCLPALFIDNDQIQTFGVGALAPGLAAKAWKPRLPFSLLSPPSMK